MLKSQKMSASSKDCVYVQMRFSKMKNHVLKKKFKGVVFRSLGLVID